MEKQASVNSGLEVKKHTDQPSLKLVIQIPCYNEEDTLKETLADLPGKIAGISEIKILIIDDGSTDNTVQVAIDNGADYIIRNRQNRGLANTFSTGIEAALTLGADIIVNTDGDNQYQGKYITDLVKPIVEAKTEIVIGCRPIEDIDDFSKIKKKLQRFGSYMVSRFAGISIPDTTSGFRAYSRTAAMSMVVVSSFTYTLETIIQAGRRRIPVMSIPIETNRKTRESRLFKSSAQYVRRSMISMLLVSTQLRPLKTFSLIGGLSLFVGVLIGARFLISYYLQGGELAGTSGHVQSLILAAVFLLFGSTSFLVGLIADQISANRVLLEEIYSQNRMLKYGGSVSINDVKNLIYCKVSNSASVCDIDKVARDSHMANEA